MAQARTEFAAALNQIASEKGVETSVVLEAIKSAALAAYKKDLTLRSEPIPEDIEEYTSEVDRVTGEISILNQGKNVTPPGFARIAASIARQVIMQRLNEAEKGAILTEYESKVGTVISGSIQRQEGSTYFVDLGRAEGVLPLGEQVRSENYLLNQRMKFIIKEIRDTNRGPEVVLSRVEPDLVKGLFAMEVPEIQAGSVEIKAIAREAGGRTKIAAISNQDGVDPVGSLVGQKGVRVQQVMSELGEEKIDIITYSDDPARFIAAALSPAKDVTVKLDEENKVATVTVPESQLSLAIGKGGQNVRLAAKLTGWKIDIEGSGEPEESEQGTGESEQFDKEGTGEQKEQPQAGAAPSDDTSQTDDSKKEEAKEEIKEEVKEAEEPASTDEEKAEAEKAGQVLEEAVEKEKPEVEKEELTEATGQGEAVQTTDEEPKENSGDESNDK